ncbi:unnamed protein product [Arctogadus glacialis]
MDATTLRLVTKLQCYPVVFSSIAMPPTLRNVKLPGQFREDQRRRQLLPLGLRWRNNVPGLVEHLVELHIITMIDPENPIRVFYQDTPCLLLTLSPLGPPARPRFCPQEEIYLMRLCFVRWRLGQASSLKAGSDQRRYAVDPVRLVRGRGRHPVERPEAAHLLLRPQQGRCREKRGRVGSADGAGEERR